MLSDKGKNTLALRDNRQVEQPVLPIPKRTVNVITGRSEVRGVSYSTTRRHASTAVNPENNFSQPSSNMVIDQIISFIDNKAVGLINLHHNSLVMSLLTTNCRIKRVLVDNEFYTNVLFLNALGEIKIDESNIHRQPIILIVFSGSRRSP